MLKRIVAVILSLVCVFICSDAAQATEFETAELISDETGWPMIDVYCTLYEDWLGDTAVCVRAAESALLGDMANYAIPLLGSDIKFECLASLIAYETGHLEYVKDNNVGGIVSWDGSYNSYETISDGMSHLSDLLMEEYFSEDGMYYEGGTTIMEVSQHYNTNFEWVCGYVDVRLSLEERLNEQDISCPVYSVC